MAWKRRRFRGGGGRRRRFVRRMRPTTEQGSRYERCHFNFGVAAEISPSGNPSSDAIQLVGGNSLLGSLVGFGTQAAAVARLLQNPLKDFEVLALSFDVEAILLPGTTADFTDYDNTYVQAGFAIYTQGLDADQAPTTLPPYWLSQWPVNASSGLTTFNEDTDYATRTHFQRAFTLAPHGLVDITVDPVFEVVVPGWPHYRQSKTVRIRRKLSDKYALFWGNWAFHEAAPGLQSDGIRWLVNGSLWYRMQF